MKSKRRNSPWLSEAILVATIFVMSAAEAADGKAVVRSVNGTAQFSDQAGGWKTLPLASVLGADSRVRTGVDSRVDLYLYDNGPVVRLHADTTLALDKLKVDRAGAEVVFETRIHLKAGTIQGGLKKMANNSIYEVKTPTTVCSIRDGQYKISADGTHTVFRGSASVTYTNAQGVVGTRTVNAGETFNPATAKAPTRPHGNFKTP